MEIFYKDGIYSLEIKDSETNPNRTILTMYDIDGNVIWSCEDSAAMNLLMLRKIVRNWAARNLIDYDVMSDDDLIDYSLLIDETDL